MEIEDFDGLVDLAIANEREFPAMLRDDDFALARRFFGADWKLIFQDMIIDSRPFSDYLEDEFDPIEWESKE